MKHTPPADDVIVSFLKDLRDRICERFESIETRGKFGRTTWPYQKGSGGGEMSVLRGDVFEKAAVNWSGVRGDHFPMKDANGPFFATGVSLITHMRNPKMPTVHFNIRFMRTEDRHWWGGGYDLTPMGFPFEEDTRHFHETARKALTPFGEDLYEEYMQRAKEYYFIKHYGRERGVGGIFFDHVNSGDAERDFSMWRSVGDTFLDAIMPIYERRLNESWTEEDRAVQLKRRAHYVEFNLLYDRGTKFGFESGGNPEAILCSMPPLASW